MSKNTWTLREQGVPFHQLIEDGEWRDEWRCYYCPEPAVGFESYNSLYDPRNEGFGYVDWFLCLNHEATHCDPKLPYLKRKDKKITLQVITGKD